MWILGKTFTYLIIKAPIGISIQNELGIGWGNKYLIGGVTKVILFYKQIVWMK